MEVFVSDERDPANVFLELLCSYILLNKRNEGKVIKINKNSKDLLKIEKLPLLYSPNLKQQLCDSEIEIAKEILNQTSLNLLLGASKEEQEKNEKFLNEIKNDLKYDTKKVTEKLNENLLLSTFINDSQYLTICDLLAFAVVAPTLNLLSNEEKNKISNVIRWADHIQNLKGLKNVTKELKINFSLPYTHFIVNYESEKKEKKKDDNKKENNENNKEIHLMSKLDIRVGKVISITENTQGDKLYNEEIDVGNGEIRKIASGLRGKVDKNDLLNTLVVVICNLQPRNLKGWESHGMILCATGADEKIEPLRPPKDSNPGDLVYIGDLPREPASDKKCPWSKVANDLKVNDKKQATFKNELIWHTDKGDIVTTNIAPAIIS
jgi:methionine--tRNA ligase beta chain